jgi:hypothetical protein
MRPASDTYTPYLEKYFSQAPGNDVHEALTISTTDILKTLSSIPDDKGDFAYAEGKWTIKQLLIHISDAERIFAYRLLRFARGDEQQPLPFEEDDYVRNCNADKRSLKSVIEEIIAVRNATVALIESLQEEDLPKTGKTAVGIISVNDLGFVICGHCTHHLKVLRERYL